MIPKHEGGWGGGRSDGEERIDERKEANKASVAMDVSYVGGRHNTFAVASL